MKKCLREKGWAKYLGDLGWFNNEISQDTFPTGWYCKKCVADLTRGYRIRTIRVLNCEAQVNEHEIRRFQFHEVEGTKTLTCYTRKKHQEFVKVEEIVLKNVGRLQKITDTEFVITMNDGKKPYRISGERAKHAVDFVKNCLTSDQIDLVSFRPPARAAPAQGLRLEDILGNRAGKKST